VKILDEPKAIRLKIMDFLSRREHSSKEIYQKMSRKVESKEMLLESIKELERDGLLSDERFAESYFQSRKRRGFGPLRIKSELIQRGVKENLFYSLEKEIDWSSNALDALKKKLNGKVPQETKEILKLKNFLNYRGFEFQDIDKAFSMLDKENL
jgi:regulatory protein|tara:strand:- start:1485 stop:1946 length:462 start_codon:yes stop_codon:yes gene_type:complete